MAKLKAAFITDVHYGIDSGAKLGSKAPRLVKAFIKAVNKFAPDVIIDGGDRVSARNEADDRRYMTEYKQQFNEAAAPVESLIGNHDFKNLGRKGNEEIMGNPATSYSRDVGGYHLVFWNPSVEVKKDGLHLDEEDIEWLRRDLAATSKKTILFSHVPLDNDGDDNAKKSTQWIDGRFYYSEGERVRKVLEDAGNVVLCMHGHRHRNRHRELNGIHYITQQSFTHQWQEKYRVPSRAFSLIEADDEKLTVRLQGKVKKTYEWDLKAA